MPDLVNDSVILAVHGTSGSYRNLGRATDAIEQALRGRGVCINRADYWRSECRRNSSAVYDLCNANDPTDVVGFVILRCEWRSARSRRFRMSTYRTTHNRRHYIDYLHGCTNIALVHVMTTPPIDAELSPAPNGWGVFGL